MSNGECFYCGGVVVNSKKGKGDHFPTPKRHGGIDVVPCCVSCHDMKDRIRLEDWPIDWISAVMADLPKFGRETKIFLAKSMSLCMDATETLKERDMMKIPYGFTYENGKFVKDDFEQQIIKIYKALRKSGLSVREITSLLNSEGINVKDSVNRANYEHIDNESFFLA